MIWTQPGEFNRKITIQKIGDYTIDENGDKRPNWVNVFDNISAKISITSGREYWASRKEINEWDGLFKIQYSKERSTIDATMRIIYGNRLFDITNPIDPEEAHREIWIEAKEVV